MKREDKEIVFVNQSSGYLMINIINEYAKLYRKCTLLTGSLNPRNDKLYNNVEVKYLCEYKRGANLKRIFTWLFFSFQALFLLLFKYRKGELFLVSNPPVNVFWGWFFSKRLKYFLVYDLYPDALFEYNILNSKSFLGKLWQRFNCRTFKYCQKVFCLSNGMKERIGRYVTSNKISIVPVWSDNYFLKPISKEDNLFLKNKDFKEKFLIVYSGNMGRTHPVEKLVEMAKLLDSDKFHIILIGGGFKYSLIRGIISSSKMENIELFPWQPVEMLPYTLSAADLNIVTLDKESSKLSVPSKTFDIMSVGNPILALASKESELYSIIHGYSIGEVFEENEIESSCEYINELYENKLKYKELSSNSLKASKNFTKENAKMFLN